MNKESFGTLMIILGMQYGSEGKGSVTSYLASIMSMGVRSGAANAGHTIYYKGRKFVMRQIPSVWINPLAKLVIGIGSMISKDVLLKEIEEISKFSEIKNRLFIDRNAHVITEEQIQREQKTDLALRIGSTSAISREGIGAAIAAKVLREESCLLAKDVLEFKPYLADTVDMINSCLDDDQLVILEGTQGFLLSLEHGEFPRVTSRDISASALAASIGVSTHEFYVEVLGVIRPYPIRVAGNSGSFGKDAKEITWQEVTKISGAKIPIIEKTTVTGNIRRVGTFSKENFVRACKVNRPTELVLTFADYLDYSIYEKEKTTNKIGSFVETLESLSGGVPVGLIKTGPQTVIDLNWYRRSMIRKIG